MSGTDWPYKPNMVQIETVQGCNRRCKFCGTMGIERAFYYTEIETVKHTCKSRPSGGGENTDEQGLEESV